MQSLRSRQFVWRDKDHFSMSSISDPLLRRVQSRILLNQPRQHVWCLNVCRWPLSAQAEFPSESVTSLTCQMAEEIAMSLDCGFQLVQVCQKSSRITYFFWFFVQSCLYSFFLTNVKILEYRPKFLSVQTDCFVLTHIISVIEIAGLACGTTFVGTIEEGREMTSDPLTSIEQMINAKPAKQTICVAWQRSFQHVIDIWPSLLRRVQSRILLNQPRQHVWCLNVCGWPLSAQAEFPSESVTSLTCQMAEETAMSFGSARRVLLEHISYQIFWCFVQSCSVSYWKIWTTWNIRQIFARWGRLLCC